jgi:uncharacterized Rmd1/YagE family protein
MKKTMNDAESDGDSNVAILVFGEYGHIVSFAFAESESDENIQQLLYFLQQRILRLGGEEDVNAVVSAYSNVCCENILNLS